MGKDSSSKNIRNLSISNVPFTTLISVGLVHRGEDSIFV